MNAKWLILAVGRTHGVSAWSDAVAATGRTGRVVAHLPTERDEIFGDDECVVVNGVATDIQRLLVARPWRSTASLVNAKAFACETYLGAWGEVALQREWRLLTIGEAARDREQLVSRYGVDGRVFLRPDAHDKPFDGGLYDVASLASWHSQLSLGLGDPTRQVLVARPRAIDAEWRLFVSDRRVVTGSSYLVAGRLDSNQPPPADVVGFADDLARQPYPGLPDVYVVDVCRSEGRPWLVEVGSALSSAPDGSDLRVIVDALSNAALRAVAARE